MGTADTISVGNGGWVRFESTKVGAPVFLKFEEQKGRLVVIDLFLASRTSIDAEMLRRIPFGLIESETNTEPTATALRAGLDQPGVDLRTLVSYFGTSFGPQVDHWVARSLKAQIWGSGEKNAPIGRLVSSDQRPITPALKREARLKVPAQRAYGDDFYRDVARVYNAITGRTKGPAVLIGEANDVPTSTAHRWIKQARSRGFLPPGTPGKAG